MAFRAVNPATGETLSERPEMDVPDALRAADACHAAFADWRKTSFAERAAPLRAAAALLRKEAGEYARLMAMEMGKPVKDGRAEIEKCAWGCEYYAEHAARFLSPETVATEAKASFVAFNPLGIILGVMPWNFPFWQVFRAAAPALMAGNGFLLKHASNVPGCAAALEEILARAGLPQGLFRNLPVTPETALRVLEHPSVRGVTLTGSVGAGKSLAAKAGSLLKKAVLELGGSDAYLILEDADLEAAARICARSRLINAGQSCVAAKRFLVVEPARARFEALLTEAMAAVAPADPLKEDTVMGPLARHDLRDSLHRQVEASLAQGARLLAGGRPLPGPGAYYPPTVLAGVGPGMPAFEEETFGPVAAIIPVKDEAEAIEVANGSRFGLGGAVFTRNRARGERIAAEELEAGLCFVNGLVRSDPRLPFGGVKESGYGRELSHFGIREFVNVKTVWSE